MMSISMFSGPGLGGKTVNHSRVLTRSMTVPKAATVLMLASVLALPGVSAQAIDLNPFSAIKGAVEAAVEDRSSADIAKDLEIKAKITADVVDALGKEVISISADVY